MSTKDFLNIGLETTKGSALHSLKDEGSAGALNHAILTLTGVVVDTETFTLGSDVYEINVIATDNTLDTGTGGEYNNTSPGPIQVPLTSAQVSAGDVILIGSEFMKVTAVGASSSTVVRGYAGSTIAAHGNSVTILEAVQQIAAGSDFAVPVSATAAATADGQIVAAVNYFAAGANEQLGGGTAKVDQAGLTVSAAQGVGTSVVFGYDANGSSPAASTETFTNGAFGGAVFVAGVEAASQQYSKIIHKVTAGDVSAGSVDFLAPFTVNEAFATVYLTTGLVDEAWDGAVVVTGNLVQVNNAGASDWAAGETIVVQFYA
jgi:hypothetical protein